MTNGHVDRAKILALFEDIQASFPDLSMQLHIEHPHVDLMMDVPRQDGLAFDVNLNLQDDELHLSAGSFWLEWFPCGDSDVVGRYREAVTRLLSGQYRIIEHYAGNRVVKAQLQRPDGDAWRTIGTWSNFGAWWPWRRGSRILQNRSM
jgi:hypothetical protein